MLQILTADQFAKRAGEENLALLVKRAIKDMLKDVKFSSVSNHLFYTIYDAKTPEGNKFLGVELRVNPIKSEIGKHVSVAMGSVSVEKIYLADMEDKDKLDERYEELLEQEQEIKQAKEN